MRRRIKALAITGMAAALALAIGCGGDPVEEVEGKLESEFKQARFVNVGQANQVAEQPRSAHEMMELRLLHLQKIIRNRQEAKAQRRKLGFENSDTSWEQKPKSNRFPFAVD